MPRRLLAILVVAALLGALGYVYTSRRPAGEDGGAPQARGWGALSQRPVAVITEPVRSMPLAVELEAVGTARAREAVEVTSKSANTVTAVRFDEGQRVGKGVVLVELDGAQARADLAAAEAALKESESNHRRSQDLFARQALSQSQLEQIEAALVGNRARVAAAQARLSDTIIRAPFAGRVGLRRVSVGSLVNPGFVITTLDDTSVIKLDFNVPEAFLSILQPGLAVAATSVAYPGRIFSGQVASIDSRVDPVSRSVTVRAELPNAEALLKPGMFMAVRLTREPMDGLVVAESAIVPERGSTFVFVVADDKVTRREVTLGRREPGQVEVLSGLKSGERVIVQGTQKVREGSTVFEQGEAAG